MDKVLAELRKEAVPIIIVLDLLLVWSYLIVTRQDVPPNVDTLVTAVVVFYFGSRTGQAAATRALNGQLDKQREDQAHGNGSALTPHG